MPAGQMLLRYSLSPERPGSGVEDKTPHRKLDAIDGCSEVEKLATWNLFQEVRQVSPFRRANLPLRQMP